MTNDDKINSKEIEKTQGGVTAFEQDADEQLPAPVQKINSGDEDIIEED